MRVFPRLCVLRFQWKRHVSTLGQRIDEHLQFQAARDALPTTRADVNRSRFPCAHCSSEVLHVAHVWCCATCGAQRCQRCQKTGAKSCPQCGEQKTVLSQTTVDKTKLGIQMWRVPAPSVPQIMYIRMTAHAVGVGGSSMISFVFFFFFALPSPISTQKPLRLFAWATKKRMIKRVSRITIMPSNLSIGFGRLCRSIFTVLVMMLIWCVHYCVVCIERASEKRLLN